MPDFILVMAMRSQWSHNQPSVKMQMVGDVSLRARLILLGYLCKHQRCSRNKRNKVETLPYLLVACSGRDRGEVTYQG